VLGSLSDASLSLLFAGDDLSAIASIDDLVA